MYLVGRNSNLRSTGAGACTDRSRNVVQAALWRTSADFVNVYSTAW